MQARPIAVVLTALALASCAGGDVVAPQPTNVTGSVSRPSVAAAGMLGKGIGADLDERDRQRAFSAEMQALDLAEPGEPVGWRGSAGRYGTVVPGAFYETRGTRCRDYSHTIYIDGRPLREPYIEPDRRDIGPEERFRVPQGNYFVMGDNRSQSCDSREWGPVPEDNLIGKVFMTYWPPQRISFR